jgi:hypothetical protein
MELVQDSSKNLNLLSELVLTPPLSEDRASLLVSNLGSRAALSLKDLKDLEALANTNHVIIRAFEPLQAFLEAGDRNGADFVANSLARERDRITHALDFLNQICAGLEAGGCPVIVMKSLDHWPDLGSDLDLFTDAAPSLLIELMRSHFNATLENRSWGDRLANKWNFIIPGLPELVEVHVGRLGQTGEQTAVTRSLISRARQVEVARYTFRVPAPEDRIIISTLQRMYRHFYIRLCDIVDNARLMDSGVVDYTYLRSLGSETGLWEGIATYLAIVSDYVEGYRGTGASLPSCVTRSAKFNIGLVKFRRNFLRVPILPHSVNLYASELGSLLLKGQFRNSFRLSLLPYLATAAALEQKLTGSDKGIW